MSLDTLMSVLRQSTAEIENRRRGAQAVLSSAAAQMGAGGGGGRNYGSSGGGGGGRSGKVRNANPSSRMKTMNFQGHSYTVNARYAKNFQGFLKALSRRGYNPGSIGGYVNRNIAGTNTKSLHSYGLAIDIDPGKNPVTYGRRVTALPKGVGKLANRYGLVWGGNWNGSKKDTMHFSIPYKGLK